MKQIFKHFWLLAILIAAGLTACSNDDNAVDIFSPEKVVGKWYYEAAQHGAYGKGSDAFEFEKVAIYGNLRADGTGSWYALFFDAHNNLIDTGNLFFAAGCQYTTSAEGVVHVALNGQSSITELMPSWDMTYQAGVLTSVGADAKARIQLYPITPEQDTLVQTCLRELGMGYSDDEHVVDLSELRGNYEAQDGDVLTGEVRAGSVISIADGATVTLNNCKILFEDRVVDRHPAIICRGSANIILMGTNLLIGGAGGNPALHVAKGSTLTISGYGTLEARGNLAGAGIGCGENSPYKECGNIIIKSGRIEAYAASHAAGIGSCQTGTCGDITIEGGEVYAYGAEYGAGIGSGYYGKCGNITIGDAHVESQGGSHGAGIGGGNYGKCQLITINKGSVQAIGGAGYPGIGVGPDKSCVCDTIKINGGEIISRTGKDGCIGMGKQMNSESTCGPILISNKIKSLTVHNPAASGTNLRTVIFSENMVFGNTTQAFAFWGYVMVILTHDYDEVKEGFRWQIYNGGKTFSITRQ